MCRKAGDLCCGLRRAVDCLFCVSVTGDMDGTKMATVGNQDGGCRKPRWRLSDTKMAAEKLKWLVLDG